MGIKLISKKNEILQMITKKIFYGKQWEKIYFHGVHT